MGRFWTCYTPFLIDTLFRRGYDKYSDFDFAHKCYSNEVKNGFCVDLNDEKFKQEFHKVLGRMHIDVNYDRKYVKYENKNDNFEYVNAWKQQKCECTKERKIKVSECPFIKFIADTLKKSEFDSNKLEFEIMR